MTDDRRPPTPFDIWLARHRVAVLIAGVVLGAIGIAFAVRARLDGTARVLEWTFQGSSFLLIAMAARGWAITKQQRD